MYEGLRQPFLLECSLDFHAVKEWKENHRLETIASFTKSMSVKITRWLEAVQRVKAETAALMLAPNACGERIIFIPYPMRLHNLGGREQGWRSQQMLN